MEAPRTTAFGPAQIVALALICVAALGLAYLHFGTGSDPVSVPSGAQAGQLELHPCQYATEKITLGAMTGLATLTVLALLWLPLRLRRRGSFGRTASGAIRSASPLLFGLGGWCLGALVALAALPTVPITSELLVALSAGLPTGLGIYCAWANRDWSARIKTMGFAAAAGGALVGAWLGFNVKPGLFAPLLAIAGAAVGANLAVLALDIASDRRNHRHVHDQDSGSHQAIRTSPGGR